MKLFMRILLLFSVFQFGCKKDIVNLSDYDTDQKTAFQKNSIVKPMGNYDPTNNQYVSLVEYTYSTNNYAISYCNNGNTPRHITKWELYLTNASGGGSYLVASGNLDFYEALDNHFNDKHSIGNYSQLNGTYKIYLTTDKYYANSTAGWVSTPLTVYPSSESIIQSTTSGDIINAYGYFNNNSGEKDHFYSRISTIYKGFVFESIAFKARSPYSPVGNGWVPLYRYFSPHNFDHFYTKTQGSYGDYQYEGVEFLVRNSPSTGYVPLYRYYSGSNKDHYYTVVSGSYGDYNYEGIECYVIAP